MASEATPSGNRTRKASPAVADPAAPELTLAQKIAAIALEAGTLSLDGQVEGKRGFKYATVGNMAATLVPLLAKYGVAIIPAKTTVITTREVDRQKQDYVQWRWMTQVIVDWTITDGFTTLTASSEGKSLDADGSEKDGNQAQTFARINMYKSVFHLVAGDDPEPFRSTDGAPEDTLPAPRRDQHHDHRPPPAPPAPPADTRPIWVIRQSGLEKRAFADSITPDEVELAVREACGDTFGYPRGLEDDAHYEKAKEALKALLTERGALGS